MCICLTSYLTSYGHMPALVCACLHAHTCLCVHFECTFCAGAPASLCVHVCSCLSHLLACVGMGPLCRAKDRSLGQSRAPSGARVLAG